MSTVILLILSNVFMTIAWYGHLKYKDVPLWKAITASWLIAFFEYCLQVPANRIGNNQGFSPARLKIIQEAITLVVFAIFAAIVLHKPLRWNHAIAFALVMLAVFFVSYWDETPTIPPH